MPCIKPKKGKLHATVIIAQNFNLFMDGDITMMLIELE